MTPSRPIRKQDRPSRRRLSLHQTTSKSGSVLRLGLAGSRSGRCAARELDVVSESWILCSPLTSCHAPAGAVESPPSQNLMRRAVDEILDPSPRDIDPLWKHFDSCCAYCGKPLSRELREGHRDHAVAGGGNGLGNLVLSCGSCNGDEKREASWHGFLEQKTIDPDMRSVRQARIEAWFEPPAARPSYVSAGRGGLRGAGERQMVEQFGDKCAELRQLMKDATAWPQRRPAQTFSFSVCQRRGQPLSRALQRRDVPLSERQRLAGPGPRRPGRSSRSPLRRSSARRSTQGAIGSRV